MSLSKDRVSQQNPQTGAQPSEQTAQNAKTAKTQQTSAMLESDKQLYQLVQNMVEHAGVQFGDNLEFNTQTLCDVLFANIRKVLEQKLEDDEFAKWIADKLVEQGAVVTKHQAETTQDPKKATVTQIVDAVSPDDYQALLGKVQQSIALVQTQKLEVLKHIQALDDSARGMSEDSEVRLADEHQLQERRAQEINELVNRIQENQESLQSHVQEREAQKQRLAERISEFGTVADKLAKQKQEASKNESRLISRTRSLIDKIGKSHQAQQKSFTLGRSILGKSRAKTSSILGSRKKSNTAIGRLTRKMGVGVYKTKKRISNSFIGKTYRTIAKVVSRIVSIAKKIYVGVKKTIKAAWKVTKFSAKAFYGASKLVGRGVRAALGGVVRGVKHARNLAKQGKLGAAVKNFAPAQILTKLGWKAIKFVGRKIWQGIKFLAVKAMGLVAGLFGLVGKFVNKLAVWAGIIGHGIKYKAYRFIVKPIAAMLTTIFSFVFGVVMAPINFIKWVVTSVLDRVNQALQNIKAAVKNVLASTMTLLGRILKNPITWVVIITGVFLLFRKQIFKWLQGEHKTLREGIVAKLKWLSSTLLGFLKKCWMVLFTVGKFLFEAIEWLTNPDGWIATAISTIVKTVIDVKHWITEMVKKSGQSGLDAFCMFLAGDYLGLALSVMGAYVVKAWDYLKNTKLFRMVRAFVGTIVGFGKLVFSASTVVLRSLSAGVSKILKGDFGGVAKAIVKPWTDLWSQVKDVMSGRMFNTDTFGNEALDYDPVEVIGQTASDTKIAVRSLGMKGTQEKSLEHWERYQAMKGQAAYGPLLPRIQKMNQILQDNAQQVLAYQELIETAWKIGSDGPDPAQEVMRQMLESPELSQKLLSAFFYVNPQTGKTMMLRPAAYIGQFLDNIREMVSVPDRDNEKTFKTLVEAFDQINKERAHIINNQGKVLADFSEKLSKFNVDIKDMEKNNTVQISDYIKDLNGGDLFSAATAQQSFKQMMDGQAKTEDIKSITGDSLGNNDLLATKPIKDAKGGEVPVKDSDFVMPEPPKPESPEAREKIGNIILPPGYNPPPPEDPTANMDMRQMFDEYHKKRMAFLESGHSYEDADAAGMKNYDFDEFVQNYKKLNPKSKEELEREEENTNKRAAAYRNTKMIQAYHSQGKEASEDGFVYKGNPSILQIAAEGLSQNLYMFSPEWQRMNNAVVLNEDEIMLAVDKDNREVQERIRKAREEKERKKKEEEMQRQREQEILDYSAKVSGGFIEVKVGEDVTAMREAFDMHHKKREEFMDAGHSYDEADAAGLKNYDWEEWQRYYRKMHGLPEDGIKRIPFEGKRKERQIDWSARYPMSVDELGKYGIEMSQDGPVMIPLDKAMAAAGSLLAGAKTIYSVRDGLEVMRQGLTTETNKLKEQNKNGSPLLAISTGGGEGAATTDPQPPDADEYSEPQ